MAICTMIIAMIYFGVFMMEMDKQILFINWLWSVRFSVAHTHLHGHTHKYKRTQTHTRTHRHTLILAHAHTLT